MEDVNGKQVMLLFTNDEGIPIRPDSVTQFWMRFVKRHSDKIKRIRFQDLRHFSASLALSEDVNMKIIQERLGHKNIKTTMNIYAHVNENDDKRASDVFEKFYKSSR